MSAVEWVDIEEDRWVEVTCFGDLVPRYLLASDGREATIERAKTEYVYDRIGLDELERRIEAALRGRMMTPRQAIRYYEGRTPMPHSGSMP